MPDYFEINEFTDVLKSLEILEHCLSCDALEQLDVKWTILSAHSALQGACVCLLTKTDGTGALTKDSNRLLLEYHNQRSQKAMCETSGVEWILPDLAHPETRVASLRELAQRLPENLHFSIAKPNSWPEDEETQNFTRLSMWRNEFTHFPPQSWLIELTLVPAVVTQALKKIEQIVSSGDFKRFNKFANTDILNRLSRIRLQVSCLTRCSNG